MKAGISLLGIANKLKDAKGADSITAWLLEHDERCSRRSDSLKESVAKDGRRAYARKRLREVGRGLGKLAKEGTPLAFIGMRRCWPPTSNAAEIIRAIFQNLTPKTARLLAISFQQPHLLRDDGTKES